jgi:hypothetical protein
MLDQVIEMREKITDVLTQNGKTGPAIEYTYDQLAKDLAFELAIQGITLDMVGSTFITDLVEKVVQEVKVITLRSNSLTTQICLTAYSIIVNKFFDKPRLKELEYERSIH